MMCAYVLFVTLSILVHKTQPQCLSKNDEKLKISEKNRQVLLQSQLQFSTDLLREVNKLQPSENIFFSPSSVYNALLLAYFVSANNTQDSLKKLLKIPADQEKPDVFGAYSIEKYYQKLRSIKNSLNYQLSNANRMFINSQQKVRDCIKTQFMDEIVPLDFNQNVSSAIEKINNWVSSQTRNNINDLISPDSLNSNTNLVLVNTAYFQGVWKSQFSPNETNKADFTLANGTSVPVMMMSLEQNFSHNIEESLAAEVLELPYEGGDVSMYIILPLEPSATAITDLINKTEAHTFQQLVDSLTNSSKEISISIPKFSVDQTLELTPVLESMGVGDLFQSTADLSTLTGAPGLWLDSAVHKAKVTVDETGTVAAAATAIFANRFAEDSFVANHPFLYFLFDKKSNVLLFAGVFNSPET